MSEPIKDGGPAFPCSVMDFQQETGTQVVREQYFGLSMRDWFAGMALQGWIANPERLKNMEKSDVPANVAAELSVAWAFRLADAMLKERAKP